MRHDGDTRGAVKQRVEEVVLNLIEHRDHLSFSQLWRILVEAVPLRLSGTLLLSLGTLVGSAFSLGWQGHRILNPTAPIYAELPSPEETVSQYYALLSSGQHGKAWKILAKGQYEPWITFWTKVEQVSVLESVTLREDANQAIVQVKLRYIKKSKDVVNEQDRLYLSRDSEAMPWKINKAELLNAR